MEQNNLDTNKFLTSLDYTIEQLNNSVSVYRSLIENVRYFAVHFPVILNNLLLFFISAKDISIAERLYFKCASPDEQNFIARNLCLLIYEFLDDGNYYLGKSFTNQIKQLPNSLNILSELSETKKIINEIQKTHKTQLAEIRHNSIGHKDKDAKKLLSVIESAENLNLGVLLLDVLKLNRQIIKLEKIILAELQNAIDISIKELSDGSYKEPNDNRKSNS